MPAKRLTTRLALATALLLSGLAHAQVNVQDAWVRATVPQQKATGAFMRLTAAQDMRLVGASSPAAGVTEVHEMKLVDNVMKMRAVPLLELPAGQAVELKPGGYHIMLLDLKQPVAQGATVPLTLVFEGKDGQRQSQELQVPARALGAAAAPAAGHGKHGGH
ncbi:MAG: copper chaperone PCu(A)C [Proteobacteria bacterium]|nr:copper chaperone PCu(A)C [Pseudomonadota bacterium]